LPKGVTVTISGQSVTVKGPKGELTQSFPDLVDVQQEGERLLVTKRDFRDPAKSRQAYSTHGLVRSLVQGMVEGTSTGFTKELIMTGVGYRGAVAGTKLTLNLGYSHPVEIDIPKGVSVQIQKNTNLFVTGHDKCQVGDFSAYIRSWRPPEPYKGKGIRYSDEVVRRKEGKRGK
jgi:large subunit ribosomal protein L6